MLRTRMHIDASPEDVFAVLADGDGYADWVVGGTGESGGPAAPFLNTGATLEPSVGAGLFSLQGRTEVVRSDPPRMLELSARVKRFQAAYPLRADS